jgi:hypothetical protein
MVDGRARRKIYAATTGRQAHLAAEQRKQHPRHAADGQSADRSERTLSLGIEGTWQRVVVTRA